MRSNIPSLLLLTAVIWSATGCAVRLPTPTEESPILLPVLLERVETPTGKTIFISELLQDRVVLSCSDGRLVTKVVPTKYLLLVVSRPDCEWTRKFVQNMRSSRERFRSLNITTALILHEKSASVPDWCLESDGFPELLFDEEGRLYNRFVSTKTPSVILLDSDGRTLLGFEGYVPSAELIRRIEMEDFSPIGSAPG